MGPGPGSIHQRLAGVTHSSLHVTHGRCPAVPLLIGFDSLVPT